MTAPPLALEYHGKAQAAGHWRKDQELIDALAYIDPLTPDVKQQVDRLIEEEMRRSKKRPADYLKELPIIAPARFEGHPALQREYERVRSMQPMQPLDVSRYRLDPPPQAKRNDISAWAAASDNAHAQLEHQMNRITNLELLLKYGANAWRAQASFDEALLKQYETTLQGLRKSIDQLNRERKLQQSAAGAELRKLEDQYYSALRKNLEISAACQAVEDEMGLLESRIQRIELRQQQDQLQQQQPGGGTQQQPTAAEANGVAEQPYGEQQQQQQEGNALANGPASQEAAGTDAQAGSQQQQQQGVVAMSGSAQEQREPARQNGNGADAAERGQ